MSTELPTHFRQSRALLGLTAGWMVAIAVLVALSALGVFDPGARIGSLSVELQWEPLRVWVGAWVGASLLYGLLCGALAREVTRLAPGAVLPPGRAMGVAALPIVNVMLLPGLFDESARFVGERLCDPPLEQRLRYLARGPASVAVGGLFLLLLLGVLLPSLVFEQVATRALVGVSLAWLLLPPLLRAWHLFALRRAFGDVLVREEAARQRARRLWPVAA